MVYRAIGIMSGSSLDGLDIAYAFFQENAGQWSYELKETACIPYDPAWRTRLENSPSLPAREYQLLHTAYGHFIGEKINEFIRDKNLAYQVDLIASHGHTVFHMPEERMTAQIGEGAAIAAETELPVITDLRAMDLALGGQGAPIVPIGEKYLFPAFTYFLNLGGIANLTVIKPSPGADGNRDVNAAFDICPANRVLNMLARDAGKEFDENGSMAAAGKTDESLLARLNEQDYYQKPFPKSLSNEFGTHTIYPLIKSQCKNIHDALRTYCDHIAFQIFQALKATSTQQPATSTIQNKLLVTGGGAFNGFLIKRIKDTLIKMNTEVMVPGDAVVNFKEALVMAFMGVLRWRQEPNTLAAVTGARHDSIGGAIWQGASQ
jgi:anhydro-N-acetylmuramic acid kinase